MSETGENLCSICRSTTIDTNNSTTPCGHVFHFSCLLRWSGTSNMCPDCRSALGPAPVTQESEDEPVRTMNMIIEVSEEGSESEMEMINSIELREEIMSGFLHGCVRDGNLTAAKDMLRDKPHFLYRPGEMGDLLSHCAVLSENESVLMFLANDMSMNMNLQNDSRMFPLHYAVMIGSVRMTTLLLNRGAFIDCQNNSWKTPLMIACERGDRVITELLLDRGASTQMKSSDGTYPIHFAVKAKSHTCLRKLITAGANVNSVDNNQNTPLHISADLGFFTVSRNLLDNGAETESKNKFGQKPLDQAIQNRHRTVRDLIQRYVG